MENIITESNWEYVFAIPLVKKGNLKQNLYENFKNIYDFKTIEEFYSKMKGMVYFGDVYFDSNKITYSKRMVQLLETMDVQIIYVDNMKCICNKREVKHFGIIQNPDDKKLYLIGRNCIKHFVKKPSCLVCHQQMDIKNYDDDPVCSKCSIDSFKKIIKKECSDRNICSKCMVKIPENSKYDTCFKCSGMVKCKKCNNGYHKVNYDSCFKCKFS